MKKENKSVGFALQGIKTEQFAIIEENYAPKKEIGLRTDLQFKLDSESKQIGTFLTFDFLQGKKVFIKIQVSCHFKIEDESWHSYVETNKLILPKDFLAHLAMITLGTTRGVLFAKSEGTPFSKYIVPTFNVADMIAEDATFDLAPE